MRERERDLILGHLYREAFGRAGNEDRADLALVASYTDTTPPKVGIGNVNVKSDLPRSRRYGNHTTD